LALRKNQPWRSHRWRRLPCRSKRRECCRRRLLAAAQDGGMGVAGLPSVVQQGRKPSQARDRYTPFANLNLARIHELAEHVTHGPRWETEVAADLGVGDGKIQRRSDAVDAFEPPPERQEQGPNTSPGA